MAGHFGRNMLLSTNEWTLNVDIAEMQKCRKAEMCHGWHKFNDLMGIRDETVE